MDDFNSEPTEETMRDFMELYDLKKVSPSAYMLVVTVVKTYFRKMKPKTISYRSYKNFGNYTLTGP